MSRIIHLSDLHFGRARPELLAPLTAQVNALAPDLVAISGDLTQRARSAQFREAAAFIEALDAPVLVVPGNHDIPLHDPVSRILRPWRNYHRLISRDLEPEYADDGLVVLGVNTVNRFAHQSGRFSRRALARIATRFAEAGDRARIIVAHHPLEQRATDTKRPTRGAARAVDHLARLGADMILTGHLHSWRAEPFAHKDGRRALLQIHAGTGLSTRLRGEENDFNLIETAPGEITVTRHAAGEGDMAFAPDRTRRFTASHTGWSAGKD
ncbi:metallophosphoesterase family protein [Roseovarius aquimarinus]|uniref:Metallophosphoesterase family protein n=1 Tax=Roseovarius aquimarinus TaxID=1229156 RepID=A0ABW7IAY0_9RHOB